MRLKSLLDRLMYKDIATVYRTVETENDFVSDYEEITVYEDIPCKLSQYGKDMLISSDGMAPVISENLRMTCDPSYDIQPNDYVVVTHQGQEFKLNASKSFCYPTHQEISLLRVANVRSVGD